jgi:hypothetical protein
VVVRNGVVVVLGVVVVVVLGVVVVVVLGVVVVVVLGVVVLVVYGVVVLGVVVVVFEFNWASAEPTVKLSREKVAINGEANAPPSMRFAKSRLFGSTCRIIRFSSSRLSICPPRECVQRLKPSLPILVSRNPNVNRKPRLIVKGHTLQILRFRVDCVGSRQHPSAGRTVHLRNRRHSAAGRSRRTQGRGRQATVRRNASGV